MIKLKKVTFLLVVLGWFEQVRASKTFCGDVDIRNHVSNFEKLGNCSVIEGSLQIVLINAEPKEFEPLHYPDLVEIQDYLLVAMVKGLRSLRNLFPNLAIIRGDTLFPDDFHTSYALIVYKNMDLKELGLINLKSISNGAVRMQDNPELCHVETVDWGKMTVGDSGGSNLALRNRNPVECNDRCPAVCNRTMVNQKLKSRCWTSMDCQSFFSSACPTSCSSGVCDGDTCCHVNCIGGCRGPTASDCVACKYVINFTRQGDKPTCVEKCPQGTVKYKHRCIRRSECLKLPDYEPHETLKLISFGGAESDECVDECPDGFIEDNTDSTKCVRCQGPCPKDVKSCRGRVVQAISNLRGFEECSVINGSLDLQLGNAKINQTLLEEHLSQIEEITGYLRILHSDSISSLRFFKKLRVIHGEELYQQRFSVVIFNNRNLQALFPRDSVPAIELLKGTIWLELNAKLCIKEIQESINAIDFQGGGKWDQIEESNGYEIPCVTGEIEDFKLTKTTRTVSMFSWKRVTLPPMHLISYQIFFKELMPGVNIDICLGEEICLDEQWIMKEFLNDLDSTKPVYHGFTFGLKPLTHYAAHVQTKVTSKAAERAVSNVIFFRTAAIESTGPINLRALAKSPSELQITWEPPQLYNRRVTRYEVYWGFHSPPIPDVSTQDYCANPLEMIEANMDDVCACPKAEQVDDSEEATSFIHALQNQVYIKRRDTPEKANQRSALPKVSAAKEDPHTVKEENNLKLNKISVVDGTETTIANLDNFQEYVIKVRVCENVTGETTQCGKFSTTIGRSLPDPKADKVLEFSSREKYGTVNLQWVYPQSPNGRVLTTEIEYSRNNLSSVDATLLCIPYKHGGSVHNNIEFINGDKASYTLNKLQAGRYTWRIRVSTLAGPGVWSGFKYFTVPFSSKNTENMECPVCPTGPISEIFMNDLICRSAVVLKSIVGRRKSYPIKVKSNIRTKPKLPINRFLNYKMAASCNCPVLTNGEKRGLIFTNPWNMNLEKEFLALDGETTILATSKQRESKVREFAAQPDLCQ